MTASRAKYFVSVGVAALAIVITFSGLQAEEPQIQDPRAEKLLRELEARRSLPLSHDRWKPENGPWAAYLDKPFEDGLSPRERALFYDAQREGNCELVRSLRSAGFLLLYPFLATVHAKPYVQGHFGQTVLAEISNTRYCLIRAELTRAQNLAATHNFSVFPFDVVAAMKRHSADFFSGSDDELETRTQNTVCEGMRWSLWHAVLHRNKAAIRDVIGYLTDTRLLVLTGEQEYLLFKIASREGVEHSWVRAMGNSTSLHADMETIVEIDRFVQEDNGTGTPVDIVWACLEPRLEPYLNAPRGNRD